MAVDVELVGDGWEHFVGGRGCVGWNSRVKTCSNVLIGKSSRSTAASFVMIPGFTAPLVCARESVSMLIFVNAMIPSPGETAGAW
jgi:hypothetical protein